MKIEKIISKDAEQNTYAIIGISGVIVVDAGVGLSEITKLTNLPVKAVLITHCHYDHISHIEEYSKLNVPIYAGEYAEEMLADQSKNCSDLFNNPQIYKINNLTKVANGEKLTIDEFEVECIQTKGHTKDGYCFLINAGENKILFSGDTLFATAIGRVDLPTGNADELIESLNKIKTLQFNLMLSGHGEQTTQSEQQAKITKWIRYLNIVK